MLAISELQVGDKAQITGFHPCDKQYRHKLLIMGLTPGQIIEFVRVAPLGDPIQIKLRGFELSLRKAEAAVMKLVKVTE